MNTERASIFEVEDELDLAEFSPVPPGAPRLTDVKDQIRGVAERKGFTSREPELQAPPPTPPVLVSAEIPRRRYTTGRNRQLNMKVTEGALRRFYAIADAQQWVLGETFEHAVTALECKLGSVPQVGQAVRRNGAE